jgi:hypothetical protein
VSNVNEQVSRGSTVRLVLSRAGESRPCSLDRSIVIQVPLATFAATSVNRLPEKASRRMHPLGSGVFEGEADWMKPGDDPSDESIHDRRGNARPRPWRAREPR